MRRLNVFDQLSLDGFFTDTHGEMSWAHKQDADWNAFMAENASSGGALVFGRVTYEMMASYWPTPAAHADNPTVAERMTRLPKIVFSRTLRDPSWENTTVLQGDLAAQIRLLKAQPGPDMVILGSGSIVAPLAAAGLIDEYQIVVVPVVLGSGRTIFAGVEDRISLVLKRTRSFSNGNLVSWYEPAGGDPDSRLNGQV